MEPLRAEVMQAQATRSDLLRWKLIAIGAIGSVGLGLAGARPRTHADLVLCALPPVCLYVDLLCLNLNLRMILISAYARQTLATVEPAATLSKYEKFVGEVRAKHDPFALEGAAVWASTVLVSVVVLLYGLLGAHVHGAVAAAFIASGATGGLGTLLATTVYDSLRKSLEPTPARS